MANPEHAPLLPLWLVYDRDRWGYSINVVRAATKDAAVLLVRGAWRDPPDHPERIDVTPLPMGTEPAVLWCHDESPDSRQ